MRLNRSSAVRCQSPLAGGPAVSTFRGTGTISDAGIAGTAPAPEGTVANAAAGGATRIGPPAIGRGSKKVVEVNAETAGAASEAGAGLAAVAATAGARSGAAAFALSSVLQQILTTGAAPTCTTNPSQPSVSNFTPSATRPAWTRADSRACSAL